MIRTFEHGGVVVRSINLCLLHEKYKPHSSTNVCFAKKTTTKKIRSYQIHINHFSLDWGVCDC